MVLEFVKYDPTCLKYVSKYMKQDAEIVLEAVKKKGFVLKYLIKYHEDDDDIVE